MSEHNGTIVKALHWPDLTFVALREIITVVRLNNSLNKIRTHESILIKQMSIRETSSLL